MGDDAKTKLRQEQVVEDLAEYLVLVIDGKADPVLDQSTINEWNNIMAAEPSQPRLRQSVKTAVCNKWSYYRRR